MVQQFADAGEIALADVLDDERIGRVQHRDVVAASGLQRLEPGVDVFDRVFGFQAFKAAGPGFHLEIGDDHAVGY